MSFGSYGAIDAEEGETKHTLFTVVARQMGGAHAATQAQASSLLTFPLHPTEPYSLATVLVVLLVDVLNEGLYVCRRLVTHCSRPGTPFLAD